jgi:hypothetical protein
LLLASVMLASGIFAVAGCQSESASTASAVAQPERETESVVLLQIDFRGQQDNLELEVPCSTESTAFEVLKIASRQAGFSLETTGQGQTAFVKSIAGVANQGAGGDNWVFHVNGALADRGSGVYPLQSKDQLRWVFGKYEPE